MKRSIASLIVGLFFVAIGSAFAQSVWSPHGLGAISMPASTTANQILYSSSANTVGEITAANSGVLTTNGSGVPSLTTAVSACTPTVTLVGGAGNTTPVYTNNICRQARFGPFTYMQVYLNGDGGAEGAGTGKMTIALPTTVNASAPGGVFPCGEFLNSTTSDIVLCTPNAAGTTVSLSKYGTLGALADFTGADQNNATRDVRLQFFYEN